VASNPTGLATRGLPGRFAQTFTEWVLRVSLVRIPAKPITHSDLMAITIPSDADHRRSEATLGCSYHAGVIGIRQSFCC
jgi:hypothetical protein